MDAAVHIYSIETQQGLNPTNLLPTDNVVIKYSIGDVRKGAITLSRKDYDAAKYVELLNTEAQALRAQGLIPA